MSHATGPITLEIDRYLATGDTDLLYRAWGGPSVENGRRARKHLRGALIEEVRRRTASATWPPLPAPKETRALTRRKTEPMVRGLFPRAEQEQVLAVVERSVVFLTPANLARLLHDEDWDRSAWNIANLYLESAGAPLLSDDAPALVGMSQETTCFLSPTYFTERHRFADFVVHEVAHIFHNCKRRTVGLPFTRRREWLLDIAFPKREIFAYACEVFSRVLAEASSLAERRTLAAEAGRTFIPGDDRVEPAELSDLVEEAAARRNGWKVILSHCAPAPRR